MIFNLANMVKYIKKNYGVKYREFFDYFFGTLALKMNIKANGKPLAFDSPRISEVVGETDNLYESVAKLAYKQETKPLLLEMVVKAKADLFANISLAQINDDLRDMEIADADFCDEMNEKFSQDRRNDEDIFVEYILYAMKLEYENRQADKKYKIAKGSFVTNKADASVCSELIEQIIRNGKTKKENVRHERAWSLEDKMNANCFNEVLKGRVSEAFDDFETVMTAIDNLSMVEMQAKKALYSSYQDAYCRVLNDFFGNDYDEDDIKKSSSSIFVAVDDFVYEHTLKGKVKIQEDVVRCNLFCITVTVFYQCKFLIKVEEEKR